MHNLQFGPLLRSLAGIKGYWLVLAILLDVATYCCAAVRWQLLLRPIGRIRLGRANQAYFAGLFANDVLPAHFGNVVRVYLAARWLHQDIVSIIPSLLMERLCESFWVVLAIGVMALLMPLPADFLQVGKTLGVIFLISAFVAVFFVLRRRKGTSGSMSGWHEWKAIRTILAVIGRLTGGIEEIGRARLLPPVLGLSLLKVTIQALAFLMVIEAFGLRVSAWAGVAVFLVTRLGTIVPSTPAAVGMFQLFCVAGLGLFGVSKPEATGFALLAFFVLTAPLWIVGFFCLAQSGVTLRQIRDEVGNRRLREKPS